MKTHWLHGEGPNKELHFAVEVDIETNCSTCIHREVCNTDVEKRCSNFKFSRSDETHCGRCIHHYTRFNKDNPCLLSHSWMGFSVPCFHCRWYSTRETTSEQLIMEQKYSHVKPDGTLETRDDTVKRVTDNIKNLTDKEKKLS